MRVFPSQAPRICLLLAVPALAAPATAWADGVYFATCTGSDTQTQPSTGWDYSSGTPTMTMTTTTMQVPRSSSGQGPTAAAAEAMARGAMGAAQGVSCSVSGGENATPEPGE